MTPNDQSRAVGRWAALFTFLLTGGFVLIALSLFWPGHAVSRASWSQAQAQQYQAASVKLHSLSHASLHPTSGADAQAARKALDDARTDYESIRAQLDSAIDAPKRMALIVRAIGVALILAGGIGMYYFRAPSKQ